MTFVCRDVSIIRKQAIRLTQILYSFLQFYNNLFSCVNYVNYVFYFCFIVFFVITVCVFLCCFCYLPLVS